MNVKICGVTSSSAALACAQAGVDFIGLNFYPPSVRYLPPEQAAEIVAGLPSRCQPVGLFVNRPPEEVLSVARTVGLDWVQLHGDEPLQDLEILRNGRLKVIRAYRLGSQQDLDRLVRELDLLAADRRLPEAILVDAAGKSGQRGGTGQLIPGPILDELARLRFDPEESRSRTGQASARVLPTRLALAGGLSPENVSDRVHHLSSAGLWMVDSASGVESEPGVKDPAKVAAFVAAVRAREHS